MIDPGIQGKGALITGVNNPEGIGAEVARALAAHGARLFLTYLRDLPKQPVTHSPNPGLLRYAWLQTAGPDSLVDEIRDGRGEVTSLEADLSDPQSIPVLFDASEECLGSVDILVHSAAHWEPDSILVGPAHRGIDHESHDRHFAVNSRATALLIAEFSDRFPARETAAGRILLISTDGASGHAGAISYGASKHAAESIARGAAWELGSRGITVNLISPGPIQTGWISSEEEKKLRGLIPMGRIGTPSDVAVTDHLSCKCSG